MNRLLLIILFSAFTWAGYAQVDADSVKVMLVTSQGAEIGVDGDISSTNQLSKWLKYGKHTVTVTYGSSFTKDFDIVVERGGKTKFELLVGGTLAASSTPSGAEIYVDGMRYGVLPQNIDLLGRHNFRIEGNKDLYFPLAETLEIKPGQMLEHNFTLSKRPPKLYGILVANYMPATKAVGVMLGIGRKYGMYIKGTVGLNGAGEEDDLYTNNQSVVDCSFQKKPMYSAANIGLLVHVIPSLYVYAGSGYGEYSHGTIQGKFGYSYDNRTYNVYHVGGAEIDLGVMFKYKALLLQAGYTRILAKGDGGSFGDFSVGLGITIHKEKKK